MSVEDYSARDLHLIGLLEQMKESVEELARTFDPGEQSNASPRQWSSYLEVTTGRGRLFGVTGYNQDTADGYLLVFDADELPADGHVPNIVLKLLAESSFSVDWGERGRAFTNGIVLAYSTTPDTLTRGSADLWLDVQYG